MRKGKIAAQCCHASIAFLTKQIQLPLVDEWSDDQYFGQNLNQFGYNPRFIRQVHLDEESAQWIDGAFTKVVVSVNSEAELLAVYQAARTYGCRSQLIQDAGRTEFHGVPTYTCVAVGPNFVSKVDAVTKTLPLL